MMNRRDFLWLTGIATGSLTVSGLISGCAIDPVSGKATFSLVSEDQEIALDKQQSPHQFSADYGSHTDARLNSYITSVGKAIANTSHRAHMPYNYRVIDANHVNAYTFPAGSMGVTRGILVELESEAELAALLGHEIGHVNARHASERATKGLLAQAAVGLASTAVGDAQAQQIVAGVGMMSATALLAKYSRDNEREADSLGMEYAVNAGANPKGMVSLMTMLNRLHDAKPSALDIMFSSHPMSDERLINANTQMNASYRTQMSRNLGRERYMDYTRALRSQKAMIKALANADLALSAGDFTGAEAELAQAKKLNDSDYALWVISAKLNMAKERNNIAIADLNKAQSLKPGEHLPKYMLGVNYLEEQQPEQALNLFQQYRQLLPGNPLVDFFVGYSYEQMEERTNAATAYRLYLQQVQQGQQAEHAYSRLKEWGLMV
ncbi:M48 family metalloprotease [Reinekea sp. G2M2-21]|uniref:M48 family metalloprotease n=1 Tax=Reinekea sp. G2M2-21 TaxID=2788942 RepID=UPI0018A98D92|nr:M48 family metalloprotease [Reinekea sp. G2M2-21]